MSIGGKIAIKVAIGVAVVALMSVVIYRWNGRIERSGVWDYDEEQLAEVRAGNHDWSDTLA